MVAVVAWACSDNGVGRQNATAPVTQIPAASVTAEPTTTPGSGSRVGNAPDRTSGPGSDGEAAAASDDALAAQPHDIDETVSHEPATAEVVAEDERDAQPKGSEMQHKEPTPEELAALRTAFNPAMTGGGVLSGQESYWCALTSAGRIVCWGGYYGLLGFASEVAKPPSGVFVAIAVGPAFACAIRADKTLVCWQTERRLRRDFAVPDGEFTSITVGDIDACAIRTDSTVECWNSFRVHQLPADSDRVPQGEFVSIAARGKRTCGVRTNGELVCWGLISQNQHQPAGGRFISVAASCAIRTDRSLACWDQAPGPSTPSWRFKPQEPYGEFISVAATGNHQCAIAMGGELACWDFEDFLSKNPELQSDRYITVAVTAIEACALAVDGDIRCFPRSEVHGDTVESPAGAPFGPGRENIQLPGHDATSFPNGTNSPSARARRVGIGDDFMCMLETDSTMHCHGSFLQSYHDTEEVIDAVAPPGRFISVVAASNHACALTTERTAVCWGPGSQERDRRWGDPLGPGAVPSGTFAILAAGAGRTCGLRDDQSVECWINGEGRLLEVPDGTFVDVAAGSEHTCALRDDGVIVCWRAFGEHETWQHSAPSGHYIKLASGAEHYCGIQDDYQHTCWWGIRTRYLDSGDVRLKHAYATFADISPGDPDTCGLRPDRTIACWDDYIAKHLQAPGGEFSEIYSRSGTSCAADAQGEVTCWGRTFGDPASITAQQFTSVSSAGYSCGVRIDKAISCWGTEADRLSALPSGEFVQVDAGGAFSCAVRADGSAPCWGDVSYLGADALPGIYTSVSVGSRHACGIDTIGTISCWGSFDDGQRQSPVGRFTAVASAADHSCALSHAHEVICWGSDRDGQSSPPPGKFTQIATGPFHSCAIRASGEVACWGSDAEEAPPSGRFVKIAAGHDVTCGIRSNANISCWGDSWFPSDVPTGEFVDVSVGWEHACGLRSNGTITCWGYLANVLWNPPEIGELRLTRTSRP